MRDENNDFSKTESLTILLRWLNKTISYNRDMLLGSGEYCWNWAKGPVKFLVAHPKCKPEILEKDDKVTV